MKKLSLKIDIVTFMAICEQIKHEYNRATEVAGEAWDFNNFIVKTLLIEWAQNIIGSLPISDGPVKVKLNLAESMALRSLISRAEFSDDWVFANCIHISQEIDKYTETPRKMPLLNQ